MAIPESVKKDALAQCGSIYSMNAPYSIGYLFTIHSDRRQVGSGMYCHRVDEIDPDRWDGYYDFKKKIFKSLV